LLRLWKGKFLAPVDGGNAEMPVLLTGASVPVSR
jgi:hypothetical protein